MRENKQAVDSMVDTILNAIKKAVDKECHYDKTFTATITKQLDTTKYELFYNGITYTCHSSLPLKGGYLVRVCAPCNNWNDLFVVEILSDRKGGNQA